jgi:hypothetical protein
VIHERGYLWGQLELIPKMAKNNQKNLWRPPNPPRGLLSNGYLGKLNSTRWFPLSRHSVTIFLCTLLSAWLPDRLWPQTSNPAIAHALSGSVVDPSTARIAGALVLLTGDATKETTTDASGHFSFDLLPGTYHVVIGATGFQTVERDEIVGDKPLPQVAVTLPIATESEIVSVNASDTSNTSADANRTALVFKKEQLDMLSDNDATLQQQLLAIAGSDGEHPPQVYIDGFTGGRFPPKSAIREVRINQNPYSAQYDDLGFGRIEVFTKPGSDKWHGSFQVQGNDRSFNSRNPFAGVQPEYHTLYLDGNLSGSLGKKTSLFLGATYNDEQNNTVVNASTLGSNLELVNLSLAVPNPATSKTYSARLDRQLTKNNTLLARYEYNQSILTNGGVGLLVLPSQGYNSTTTTQTLQLGNTQVIGAHLVNETRFQYLRTRVQQNASSRDAALVVQGAFSGGGSPLQNLRDNQDRYEFQEYLSFSHGKHFMRGGVRYRLLRDANVSTANYNGQYTFPDFTTYQRTQQGIANGLSPAQIRANGGGASQFSLTAGQPSASIVTGDLGLYAEDEWQLPRGFTIDLGFRFETQSGVPDHLDPAPRIGFAWAVHEGSKHPAWVTLRGGYGIFYDRFPSTNLLTAVRQNGLSQTSYYIQSPDFYPSIPAPSSLTGLQPTIYRLAPNLRTAYSSIAGVSAERSLGKMGNIGVNYISIRGVHEDVSRNVNAPLPGTYDPAIPTSGVRPLGGTQNIYQYSSEGLSRGNIFLVHAQLNPIKHVALWVFYIHQRARSDFGQNAAFVSNSYNVAADYGRTPWTVPNRFFGGGSVTLPYGISVEPFLIMRNGRTFNITTGADNNGDTIYNDRPSFATDLTRASVIRTPLGNFDTDPLPSQTIIPWNYGTGPSYISLQLSISKSFKFGPRPPAPAPDPAAAKKSAPPARPDPPFEFGFSAEGQNLFNRVNGGVPIGVVTSRDFGKSISLESGFFNNSAANRTISLRTYFRF